ncbi:MAG: hypothetical protein RLZZ70_669 [Candidatus Parcubacteria bacterium]|jgi:predicted PurR-regulated permease PerM
MSNGRIVEYTFFFSSLGLVGFLAFKIIYPFLSALALAAITVIICYPLYTKILQYITRTRRSLAALLTTIIVFTVIVTPIFLISSLLINESLSFYRSLDVGTELPVDSMIVGIEERIQVYLPNFEVNVSDQLKQSASWLAGNVGVIFSSTLSLLMTIFIAMFGSFYLFRDGERLVKWLISISPLKDSEDKIIIDRVAQSVRSVATGTILIAIIQGILTTIGLAIFGVERSILWGTIAAFGALIPGVGTTIVVLPAVLYLLYTDAMVQAIGLSIWGVVMVGSIDNILSPYLMSRGNNLHPFVVLLSVLGGIALFGPIGFIIGPVMISLLMVLIELYVLYMSDKPTQKKTRS